MTSMSIFKGNRQLSCSFFIYKRTAEGRILKFLTNTTYKCIIFQLYLIKSYKYVYTLRLAYAITSITVMYIITKFQKNQHLNLTLRKRYFETLQKNTIRSRIPKCLITTVIHVKHQLLGFANSNKRTIKKHLLVPSTNAKRITNAAGSSVA